MTRGLKGAQREGAGESEAACTMGGAWWGESLRHPAPYPIEGRLLSPCHLSGEGPPRPVTNLYAHVSV